MKREYPIEQIDLVKALVEKSNKDAKVSDGLRKVYSYAVKTDDEGIDYLRVFYVFKKVQAYEAAKYGIDDFEQAKADVSMLNKLENVSQEGFKRYHVLKQKLDTTGTPYIYKTTQQRKVIPTEYTFDPSFVTSVLEGRTQGQSPHVISQALKRPLVDVLRVLNNEEII
jgi:hypothetical protein